MTSIDQGLTARRAGPGGNEIASAIREVQNRPDDRSGR
jgi:hypothetical protein